MRASIACVRPARRRGGRRLGGLLVVEHGPEVGSEGRCRVGLGTRDLDEVAEVADPHPGAVRGAHALHVDIDGGSDAAAHDRPAVVAVPPHLLGHGEGGEAEPRRLAGDRPRVGLDRVEIDEKGVGRDPAGLVKRDRRLDQARIAAADGVEEHLVVSYLRALAQRQRDGGEDDQAADHQLLRDAEAHQDQAVVEKAHQQRADQRAEDRADAAVEPGTADDDGGDDGEQVGLAERVAGAVQAPGIEEAGKARGEPGQHHHREADTVDLDADGAGALGTVADGMDMGAVAGLAVDEMADEHDRRWSRSPARGRRTGCRRRRWR